MIISTYRKVYQVHKVFFVKKLVYLANFFYFRCHRKTAQLMKKYLPAIVLLIILSAAFYIDRYIDDEDDADRPRSAVWNQSAYGNGKMKKTKSFKSVYRYQNLDSVMSYPKIDSAFAKLLVTQAAYLRSHKGQRHRIGKLSFTNKDLLKVVTTLQTYKHKKVEKLGEVFDFYQIKGQDSRGNVKFSAYYTPIVAASRHRSSDFPYGIFERPTNWEGELPALEQVLNGVLDEYDAAIGYVASYEDVAKIKLEGSGILEFGDGKRIQVAYASSSSGMHQVQHIEIHRLITKTLKSVVKDSTLKEEKLITEEITEDSLSNDNEVAEIDEQQIIDEQDTDYQIDTLDTEELISTEEEGTSYPFFEHVANNKESASGVPLQAWYSIAVDKNYIPLGACLMAAAPNVDKREKFKGHTLQYVLAHDTGGRIKGPGRIDWYMGVGEKAAKIADRTHHYGLLWLMLPKKKKNESSLSSAKQNNTKTSS